MNTLKLQYFFNTKILTLFVNNRASKAIMKLCLLKMVNLIFRKKNAFPVRFYLKTVKKNNNVETQVSWFQLGQS